jgi:hypothetical protein
MTERLCRSLGECRSPNRFSWVILGDTLGDKPADGRYMCHDTQVLLPVFDPCIFTHCYPTQELGDFGMSRPRSKASPASAWRRKRP